jgi:Domain of unknown function (DUF1338)
MSVTDRARQLLDLLWDRYVQDVPYARTFLSLCETPFANDHVAFRSLRRPGSGIAAFRSVFARLGWRDGGVYTFPDAHLEAIHMSHPDGLPRVFLSELVAEQLSPRAQAILAKLPADPPPPASDDPAALAAWFVPPSAPPGEDDLLALEAESQYGAWLLAFGRKVNHFTASVPEVELWQRRLADAGVPMKSEIEGEPGTVLRQTATRAASLSIPLAGGRTRAWPYAYLEIAERHAGFDGFLGPQARQLFDMTKR